MKAPLPAFPLHPLMSITRSPTSDNESSKKGGLDLPSEGFGPESYETIDLFEGSVDPIYQAKARILNEAIQNIGMGRYQVRGNYNNHFSTSCTI